jgi:hypothetical protein
VTPAAQDQGQIAEVAPQTGSRTLSASERDSVVAQAFADSHGPRSWIYADAGAESGSRLVRANFHLDDDAYVLIGHLDADGVLRIVFPTNPGDDGFVKGNKSYMTDQFFAGFNDQYRYRAQEVSLTRGLTPQMDSYDGGLGYVFMVASWRPMRFDEFSSEGTWNRYELSEDEYLRDPRAAIQELASVLTGVNREAYTVQYARYYSTIASTGDFGGSFASGYCSGFNSLGFATSPFGFGGLGGGLYGGLGGLSYVSLLGSGAGGCSGAGSYYGNGYANYGFGYATVVAPPVRIVPRGTIVPRVPQPRPTPPHHFPTPSKNGVQSNSGQQNGSSTYRRRGLITTDDGATSGPERTSPRTRSRNGDAPNAPRPGIEQMINRRADDGNADGNGTQRYHNRTSMDDNQPRSAPNDRQSRPAPQDRQQPETRTQQSPRTAQPHVEQAPRTQSPPPQSHPVSAPAGSGASGSTARTAAPPGR